MPEPDGTADPPWVEGLAICAPLGSARRWLRRYRSGDGLAAFAYDGMVGSTRVFVSTEESGRGGVGEVFGRGMEVSSFEAVGEGMERGFGTSRGEGDEPG